MGAPVMGLQASDGEVLAGDPIPEPAGFTSSTTVIYDGEGNSAVVHDTNLWDDLIPDPTPEPEPVVVVEPEEPAPEPTPEPVVEETTPEPEPAVEEPTPEPVVEEPIPEPEPTPEPVVEEPAPEPEPVIEEEAEPSDELFPEEQPVVEPQPQPEQPEPQPDLPAEQPRETIVVTKIVEIYEDAPVDGEGQVTTPVEEAAADGTSSLMMIAIAAILGVLVLIAVGMGARFWSRRQRKGLTQ